MENEIPDLPAMLDKFDGIMAEGAEDAEEEDGLFDEEEDEEEEDEEEAAPVVDEQAIALQPLVRRPLPPARVSPCPSLPTTAAAALAAVAFVVTSTGQRQQQQ